MRAHPKRTYSVTRMPEPEINLMSFMLLFSLSKLAKRWEVLYCIRQLKDETKDREWWGDETGLSMLTFGHLTWFFLFFFFATDSVRPCWGFWITDY